MTTAKMLRRLTSVVFSAGAMLGNGAFARCYSLRSVAIAEGVERIGWFAFAWCSSLTDVEKPETAEIDIGVEAFYGCP